MSKPFKYTVGEVKKLFDDYFEQTDEKEITVTGLALIFGSKQLLQDYQNRPEYKDLVIEAKLKVENKYEKMLSSKTNPTGAIFALKNFGWTDRQEIETNVNHNIPKVIINGRSDN